MKFLVRLCDLVELFVMVARQAPGSRFGGGQAGRWKAVLARFGVVVESRRGQASGWFGNTFHTEWRWTLDGPDPLRGEVGHALCLRSGASKQESHFGSRSRPVSPLLGAAGLPGGRSSERGNA